MAKSLLSIKSHKRSKGPSRTETAVINNKFLGPEPVFEFGHLLDDAERASALVWYTKCCNATDAKQYLLDFLRNREDIVRAKLIARIPLRLLPKNAAWFGRILCNGYKLGSEIEENIYKKIDECEHYAKEKDSSGDEYKPSIQQKIKNKAAEYYLHIEDNIIENKMDISVYEFLKERGATGILATYLCEQLKELLAELNLVKTDEQVKEGYRFLDSSAIKNRIKFLQGGIDDCERFAGNSKQQRKPRTKKPVTADRQLKTFKYLNESNEYKITSINPTKIVGASEFWTFNVKYKTITVFRALDRAGLKVKGASIINFDEQNSFTYRTGRNTEKVIKYVLEEGKMNLKKINKNISLTELKDISQRIGEHNILLKVL